MREEDGMLPGRFPLTMRNWYMSTLNVSAAFFPFLHIAALGDVISGYYRPDGRRTMDFVTGTVVVEELPLREKRVEAKVYNATMEENKDMWLSDLPAEPYPDRLWYDVRTRNKFYSYDYTK